MNHHVILHCGDETNRRYYVLKQKEGDLDSNNFWIRKDKPGAITWNAGTLSDTLKTIAETIESDYQTYGNINHSITLELFDGKADESR